MNRFVSGIALVMAVNSAQAQTAVAPTTGSGTATNPYQITELGNLVWMGDNINSSSGTHYIVQNDIDASDTTNWSGGFSAIGTNWSTPFMGIFNGNGKVISGLSANRAATNYVGLFGYIGSSGAVKDLGLVGGIMTGNNYVGGLAGVSFGSVSNCYASSTVTGSGDYVGGLIGYNCGAVSESHATGTVTGREWTGGLIGYNYGTASNCHATGAVTGYNNAGGLVGYNNAGTVSGCYATGAVTTWSGNCSGGLIGYNYGGTVSGCYATGTAAGNVCIGGLIGYNFGTVSNAFATGAVTGNNYVGGLAGSCGSWSIASNCYATGAVTGSGYRVGGLAGNNGGIVGACYATGAVTGSSNVGGLIGDAASGTVTNSYWDTNTTGWATSQGGTGKTTVQMKQQATFVGWDFTNVWCIAEGVRYPFFGVAGLAPTGTGLLADPYQISLLTHLVWMGDNVDSSGGKYYTLQNDIDASATMIWDNGAGFTPIGTNGPSFLGVFDGNGRVIANMTINRPGQDYVGLFGFVGSGGVVKNLGLAGVVVMGSNYVGGLIGVNGGSVSNCHATGPVTGTQYVGGLLGANNGPVNGCYATDPVTGGEYTGGLVGNNSGFVNCCFAAGRVRWTGDSQYVGGLVGHNSGSVSDSYATGSVADSLSGLDGYYHGGLVGYNSDQVRRCYAVGLVRPCYFSGGLVGRNLGTVNASYWDTNTTGLANSSGGTGADTADMMQKVTFVGWDFRTVWSIRNGVTYPFFAVASGSTSLPWLHLLLGQ